MKKITVVMITILCMVLALGLTACNGGGKLDTPKAVITGNSLSWEPVDNASGYVVKFDGNVVMTEVDGKPQELVIKSNTYTFNTDKTGIHTVSVKAKGMDNFTDSDFSEEMTFTKKEKLAKPVLSMVQDGNNITYSWNAIEGAVGYSISIGLNLNETIAIDVPNENGTSYTIDITTDAYDDTGEYKAKVIAKSAEDSLYDHSEASNTVAYINTHKIGAPTEFRFDDTDDTFKWKSEDKEANKFRVTAVRTTPDENGKEVKVEVETSDNKMRYANLGIEKPGEYTISVVAYSTGDRKIYLDSDAVVLAKTITILDGTDPIHFKLSGSQLSWAPVVGATGYRVTATTRHGITFTLDKVEGGTTNSLDLSLDKSFRASDKIGKMFSFDIVAVGDTTNTEKLVFDSASVSMTDGSYYQYLPKIEDFDSADLRKDIIPTKVEATDTEEAYYPIKTFSELMWALKNADATIRLMNNITINNSEFVSPITSFNGKFDGNNYSISGIDMGQDDKHTSLFNRTNISLFGTLGADAVVEDLVLANVSISVVEHNLKSGVLANVNNGTINNVVIMASNNGGGHINLYNSSDIALVAYENNGTISNVVVKGTIQGKNAAGIAVINNKTIKNAAVHGGITGVESNDNVYVGGITAINKGDISYSMSYASVYANTAFDTKSANSGIVGGIVALNEGTIDSTYFSSSVSANSANKSYAGGFVGINNGTISNSYVDIGRVFREDYVTYLGGFAGKNGKTGNIHHVYTNIAFDQGYYETKAAVVAENEGTISNVAYNSYTVGDAKVVLTGTYDEANVKGYANNNFNKAVEEVLGETFCVYANFKGNIPVLKNVIYVKSHGSIATGLEQDIDLLKYSNKDYSEYYFGGKIVTIPNEIDGKPNEMRTHNYSGYQLLKYTANAGTAEAPIEVVYNRLIQVR